MVTVQSRVCRTIAVCQMDARNIQKILKRMQPIHGDMHAYILMPVHTYIHRYVHTYVWVYLRTHVIIHLNADIYPSIHIYVKSTLTSTSLCTCICTYCIVGKMPRAKMSDPCCPIYFWSFWWYRSLDRRRYARVAKKDITNFEKWRQPCFN